MERYLLWLVLNFALPINGQLPIATTDTPSIEVGPGPNAVRLQKHQTFVLNCTIRQVRSYDVVTGVEWTFENEVDDVFKVETLDDDNIDYDAVTGITTYEFLHHPTSADAGVYNCTFYNGVQKLAQTTIRLTCDPVPKEGTRKWHGLKEDDPFRRDYKHVPSFTLYPGDEATMQCRATAYPRPKFQWFRIERGVEDDDDIGTASRTPVVDKKFRSPGDDDDDDEEDHVIADGDILHIKNARFVERGYYCCTANNSDDYSLNLYFLVRVKNPLSILWPLLGIGIIFSLLAVIIGISEHLRRKREAKIERMEQLLDQRAKENPKKNITHMQMFEAADLTLRHKDKKSDKVDETAQ